MVQTPQPVQLQSGILIRCMTAWSKLRGQKGRPHPLFQTFSRVHLCHWVESILVAKVSIGERQVGRPGGDQVVMLNQVRVRTRIWKPIPVRIFYTFVIYQGYDMDILSGKSYDVIYQGYDMDIPNANNLEQHIPACHIFFDFWTNILKCHIPRISKSQIF